MNKITCAKMLRLQNPKSSGNNSPWLATKPKNRIFFKAFILFGWKPFFVYLIAFSSSSILNRKKNLEVNTVRKNKYHIYLNTEERNQIIASLVGLKNKLIEQGKYTDAVNNQLFACFLGSVTSITVPFLSLFSAFTVPLCKSTISHTSDSPRPTPPYARLRDLSTRKNG